MKIIPRRDDRAGCWKRGRWAAVALAAVSASILAACSGASGQQATDTPGSAVRISMPDSAGSSSTAEQPVPDRSTTPKQTPTVVPFRTVLPGSAVGRRIGLVSPNGSDPFSQAVTDSITGQLKSAGAVLVSCDPGDDPNLVLGCARRLATERVDGWIVVQPGNLGQTLCDVGPKKVPLIAIAASPISCATTEIGADDEQAGFLVGKELAGLPRNTTACAHTTFVIVTNRAAGTVSSDRVDGIKAGFSAVCPGLVGDAVILDAGTQDRAYDAFTATLTTVPTGDDVLVAAVNDSAALGVIAATPGDRAQRVTVAAVGADQRARCEMAADPHWLGDAALFPDRYGEVAVPALLDALAGRTGPGNVYVSTAFVTAANLAEMYPVADCPTQ